MLFSSITFLGFYLPIVLAGYYLCPSLHWKNAFLLLASLLFYAWGEPRFILVMLASIALNFGAGLYLGRSDAPLRKLLLALAVASDLFLLFCFKYLGFTLSTADNLLSALRLPPLPVVSFALPLGISFYTFQAISYVVDVYKTPSLVQKNICSLGLYIAFFPQLVAGPIVRWHDIRTQMLHRVHSVPGFAEGLSRFIVGLSKKVLLANVFARVCDTFYGADFSDYGTPEAWIACLAYALQIYYDFSGYSDMAIGLSRLFGFRLLENFDFPYAASSVTDFWRRWHISMTSFFRDYLYIPLGGNRRGKWRTVFNRYFVFFVTGLWHGAAWSFILWGLLHGTLMTIERAVFQRLKWSSLSKTRVSRVLFSCLGRLYTLLSVAFLWVLFRNTTRQSAVLLLKMFGVNYSCFTDRCYPWTHNTYLLLSLDARFWFCAVLGILFAFPWWRRMPTSSAPGVALSLRTARHACLLILFVLCWASLANGAYNPFIYFRF